MSSKTLEQLQVYKPLPIVNFSAFESIFTTSFPDILTYQFPNPEGLIGIEVEVENAGRAQVEPIVWYQKSDGSLRNNGIEWVSYPLPTNQIERALTWLYKYVLHSKVDFSIRTSIHIHLNVRNMTPDQVRSLIIAYMAVEKLLFKFEGTGRYKSIFCVPLEECSLLDILNTYIENDFHGDFWMKYTAFNLCPIMSFGTVEFRHMHGTKDFKKIMDWISLIQRLELYARTFSSKEVLSKVTELNTNSMYNYFVRDIFREHFSLINSDHLKEDMECNVMQIKYSLSNNRFNKEVWGLFKEKSPIWKKLKTRQSILKKQATKVPSLQELLIVESEPVASNWQTNMVRTIDDRSYELLYETVRRQHPDWLDEEVDEFVNVLIQEQQQALEEEATPTPEQMWEISEPTVREG